MSTYIETLTRGSDYIAPRTKIEAVENLQTNLNAKADVNNVYSKSEVDSTVATLQTKTDNLLSTTSKNIVGAINEVDSIALGANQALGVANYQTLVAMMNGATATAYRVGQNIYVQTLNVPDVWVYSVESSSVPYTYTTDEALATALDSGAVQMGYYKISKLEGQKVDLTNYVQKTDYANSSTGGTVKQAYTYSFAVTDDGLPFASNNTYSNYQSAPVYSFISKGTLENVITGKGLVSNTDYAQESVGGVIMANGNDGLWIYQGRLMCNSDNYSQYQIRPEWYHIGKTTLENVLDNESVRIDKTQSLSSAQKSQARENIGVQLSNRNLLDNPWFTINQRGVSTWGHDVYGVDRWINHSNSNATVNSDNTITITNGYQWGDGLRQVIEQDLWNVLKGKIITASFLIGNNIYSATTTFTPATETSFGSEGLSLYASNDANHFVSFNVSAGATKTIKAVKLELGSVSTLAMDVAPNYTEELLKCQRYYYQTEHFGGFIADTVRELDGWVAFPVPMRATPNITFVDVERVSGGGNVSESGSQIERTNFGLRYVYYPSVSVFDVGYAYTINGFKASADL